MGTKAKIHGFRPKNPHSLLKAEKVQTSGVSRNAAAFRFRCGVIRPLWRAAWKPSYEPEANFWAARWWWTPGLLFFGVLLQRLAMTQHVPKDVFCSVMFVFLFKADIVEKHIHTLWGRCDFWSDIILATVRNWWNHTRIVPCVVAFYCIYYSIIFLCHMSGVHYGTNAGQQHGM